MTKHDMGVINRYREYLPVTEKTPIISLSEGSTPLLFSPKLSQLTGGEVYLKFEGLNPTGSFKDRGMTMAISKQQSEEQLQCSALRPAIHQPLLPLTQRVPT